MPTYEYQCQKCGHRFSEFQRIVDPPIKDCPKCRKRNCVEQIISGGSGLIFKGSGFYTTDYKRKPSSDSGTSAKSDSPKPPTDTNKS
ncbi:zinc ribbon domain-containing protein [candidate division WOR-3 bacterium]|uniref:Zinc ribbon domain-containing protein n=1 Tax=candidate division WOR-3 bacterium TaxID=2052148 RepID=A0A937XDY6_UNCW3|nr:zinc ribbon domain-containing protein [candidate division WOR-3 bacterium]